MRTCADQSATAIYLRVLCWGWSNVSHRLCQANNHHFSIVTELMKGERIKCWRQHLMRAEELQTEINSFKGIVGERQLNIKYTISTTCVWADDISPYYISQIRCSRAESARLISLGRFISFSALFERCQKRCADRWPKAARRIKSSRRANAPAISCQRDQLSDKKSRRYQCWLGEW